MKMKLIAMALLVGLAGCGKVEVVPRDYQPEVKTIEVGSNQSAGQLYFPAVAQAAHKSALSFRVSGEVLELSVKEGTLVKKGDVLAKLDTTDYQLDVDNASAKYSVANSQYTRSAPLVKKGLLAQSQFDELAAQRAIAKAELDLAKLRLSYTSLTAPIDGIISRVAVDKFENVKTGQAVINIHKIDTVEVVVQVPDRVFTEQPQNIDFESIELLVRVKPGAEYPAKIKEYTTEPDPETATYNLTLTMPMPADDPILDGTALEIAARNNAKLKLLPKLTIPIEALFNQDGDDIDRTNRFVWVVDDSQVSKKTVEVGKLVGEQVEVVSGIEAGQDIVIAGVARLRDGMQVKVIPQEAGNE
ncbi:efflux RND transporter periplasmic adaptor subunit [Vibrio sp. SCSIO 43136]|uniref:efflux RND transporter periplasmic adaptor subunit n=1 Tax=Vibrio sp. SCSIO 43136 TaxID=2819101 RepID=UPI002074F536|nr:efflux RND transporter periplasmic adaptor subunit [Vibrio sp. SCSIO 43136]